MSVVGQRKVSVRHLDRAPDDVDSRGPHSCREELTALSATSEHRIRFQCNKKERRPVLTSPRRVAPIQFQMSSPVEMEVIKRAPDEPQDQRVTATVSRDQMVGVPDLGPVPLRPVDSVELIKVRRLDPEEPDIPEFLYSPAPDTVQLTNPHRQQTVPRSPGKEPIQPPRATESPRRPQSYRSAPASEQASPMAARTLPVEPAVRRAAVERTQMAPTFRALEDLQDKTGGEGASSFPPITSTEGVKVAPERVDLSRTFASEPRQMEPSNKLFTRTGEPVTDERGQPAELKDINGQPLPPIPGGYLMNEDGSLALDSDGRPMSVQSAAPAVQSTERVSTEPEQVRLERGLVAGAILPSNDVYLTFDDGTYIADEEGRPLPAREKDGQPLRFSPVGVMVDSSGRAALDQNERPIPAYDQFGKPHQADPQGYLRDSRNQPLLDSTGNKVPATDKQGRSLRPRPVLTNKDGQIYLDSDHRPFGAANKEGRRLQPNVISSEIILVQPERALLQRAFDAEIPTTGVAVSSQERTAVAPDGVTVHRSFTIGRSPRFQQGSVAGVSRSPVGVCGAPRRTRSQDWSESVKTAILAPQQVPSKERIVMKTQQRLPERVPSGDRILQSQQRLPERVPSSDRILQSQQRLPERVPSSDRILQSQQRLPERVPSRDRIQPQRVPSQERQVPRVSSSEKLAPRMSPQQFVAKRSGGQDTAGVEQCPVCGSGEFTVDLKIKVQPSVFDKQKGRREGRAEVQARCSGITPIDVFVNDHKVWQDKQPH